MSMNVVLERKQCSVPNFHLSTFSSWSREDLHFECFSRGLRKSILFLIFTIKSKNDAVFILPCKNGIPHSVGWQWNCHLWWPQVVNENKIEEHRSMLNSLCVGDRIHNLRSQPGFQNTSARIPWGNGNEKCHRAFYHLAMKIYLLIMKPWPLSSYSWCPRSPWDCQCQQRHHHNILESTSEKRQLPNCGVSRSEAQEGYHDLAASQQRAHSRWVA